MSEKDDEIKVDDYFTFNEGYDHLRERFAPGFFKVVRIEDNDLPYTGGKFVFAHIENKERGFYLKAVKKI